MKITTFIFKFYVTYLSNKSWLNCVLILNIHVDYNKTIIEKP